VKTELSDETLCAFLDGELSVDERRTVEAALAHDPRARARLAAFGQVDEAVRRDFPLRAFPRFDRLADRIRAHDKPRRSFLPLAASVSALAAGFAGFLIGQADFLGESAMVAPSLAGFVAQGRLATMLETQPSAETAGDAGVLASFQAKDGRFCREFELGAPSARDQGVACRGEDGWRVIAWAAAPASAPDAYRPAGAVHLIDAAVDELGGDSVLTPAEEAELINANWRTR